MDKQTCESLECNRSPVQNENVNYLALRFHGTEISQTVLALHIPMNTIQNCLTATIYSHDLNARHVIQWNKKISAVQLIAQRQQQMIQAKGTNFFFSHSFFAYIPTDFQRSSIRATVFLFGAALDSLFFYRIP